MSSWTFWMIFGSHVMLNQQISRALEVWVVLATMFTRHDSLKLLPLRLLQRSCVPHQSAHSSEVASRNWSSCWKRSQVTYVTNLCFIYSDYTTSKDFILNICSTWRPHTYKVSLKVRFHTCIIFFCILEYYEYMVHENCCVLVWILCIFQIHFVWLVYTKIFWANFILVCAGPL